MSAVVDEAKREKNRAKLQMVLTEVKDSEESYLVDLEHVIYTYMNPLRGDRAGLLSEEEQGAIFSNLEELAQVSQQLLVRLEENLSIYNVARSFRSMTERLKLFSNYCNSQDDALALVERLQTKNRKWKEFLDANQALKTSRGLGLRDFLIKPTQRICKYPLFMRELLSACDDERSTQILLDVEQRVNDVVMHINEQKRRKEGLEGTAEVANKIASDFPGGLVTDTRWLLYSGERELILLEKTNMLRAEVALVRKNSGSGSGSSSPMLSRRRSSSSAASPKLRRRSSTALDAADLKPIRNSGGRKRSGSSFGRVAGNRIVGALSGANLVTSVRLYLFNDMLMCCVPSSSRGKESLEIEFYAEIDTVRVEDVSSREFRVRLLIDEGGQFQTIFLFGCQDKFEKDSWLNQFRALPTNVMAISPSVNYDADRDLEGVDAEGELAQLEERLAQVNIFKIEKSLEINTVRKDKQGHHYASVLYSVPQWLYRAQEAFCILAQIEGHARSLVPYMPATTTVQDDDSSSEEIVLREDDEGPSHTLSERYRTLMQSVREQAKKIAALSQAYKELEKELFEMLKAQSEAGQSKV